MHFTSCHDYIHMFTSTYSFSILHETKTKNHVGVVLKLDFEKAYDKVKWKFLFECLKARGFCKQWCSWIKQVVSGGTVSVKLNDIIGPYIKSYKGVRQGDPSSPILFNFVADGLSRMIHKAQLFLPKITWSKGNGLGILYLCENPETTQYFLFLCSTAKAVWAIMAHAYRCWWYSKEPWSMLGLVW